MLAIERTEEGQLRLSDRRRTGVAAGEAEARRTLYHWGYTDLSINKALAELRRTEGRVPAASRWQVIRSGDRTHETAAPPADGDGAEAAPSASPVRRPRSWKVSGATAPSREAPRDASSAPRRERPSPRTAIPPSAASAVEGAAQPEAVVEPAPRKRSRGRAEPSADTRESEAVPAAALVPDGGSQEGEAGGSPKKRSRKHCETAAPALEAPPAETPEPSTPPRPTRARGRKKTAAAEATAASSSSAPDADSIARARQLFAEGARALRELEGSTLPFARRPWTELRAQAEHILSCLTGK